MSAPTPLAVLIARAEARALLWRAGALDLNAVDELEAAAKASGLTAAIGEDEVGAIIVAAFTTMCEPPVAAGFWAGADGWAAAAAEYRAARNQRTPIAEIEPQLLALLRKLMAGEVSLPHAAYEITAAHRAKQGVAAATLEAAEYLIQQNDAERLRKWLAQHSAQECAAILKHFEFKQQRRKALPRCQTKT